MLKNRLIPNIICRNGNNVVQSVNFKHTNIIGNAITAVDFYNNWAVDEIICLDVSRTSDYKEKFHKIINGLSERCFVPLTVGGWIKDTQEIQQFLKDGADKICINTQAFENPKPATRKMTQVLGPLKKILYATGSPNDPRWHIILKQKLHGNLKKILVKLHLVSRRF